MQLRKKRRHCKRQIAPAENAYQGHGENAYAAAKAIDDQETAQALKKKIAAKSDEIDTFCKESGLRRDHSRELVSEQTVKGVDKLQNSGTIKRHPLKINIQLFARKPSDFPTVWLSKQEYAHVIAKSQRILQKNNQAEQYSESALEIIFILLKTSFLGIIASSERKILNDLA